MDRESGRAAGQAGAEYIHERYLPFSREVLLQHFADVRPAGDPERHLQHYLKSAAAASRWEASGRPGRPKALDIQIEKDERFWVVTALLAVFHDDERLTLLTKLLDSAFPAGPPIDGIASWAQAIGDDPKLYFEANLPSPRGYTSGLATDLERRVLTPSLRELAASSRLEGPSKIDALLLAPDTGFAVAFEAKVLSDASTSITYDVMRNQLARIIDVTLEPATATSRSLERRDPDRTLTMLLTPEVFRQNPETRLYGSLFHAYKQDPGLLQKHLPHRDLDTCTSALRRFGWLTWEDINVIRPDSLPWLSEPAR